MVTNRVFTSYQDSSTQTRARGSCDAITTKFTPGKTGLLIAVIIFATTLSSVPLVHAQMVVATVNVGPSPLSVAYDSGRGEVFVANLGSYANLANGNVSVIDDESNKVVDTITVGLHPYALAYDPAKGEIFVVNHGTLGGGSVSVINDTTDKVVVTIPVGVFPSGVAYDSGQGEVFVTNYGFPCGCPEYSPGSVSVISDSTNKVVNTIPLAGGPYAIAYDPATSELFVTNTNGNVSVIEDFTNSVEVNVPVGGSPVAAVYDSATGDVFVANSLGKVSVIDGPSEALVANVTVGSQPTGVAYDSVRGEVFVANECPGFCAGTLSVISDATGTVVDTVPLGLNAYAIAYDSGQGELFVTDPFSAVSVVADSSLTASSTSVSCSPASVSTGSSSTCTATVTGSSPTGSVTWSSSSVTGTFAPAASCTLSSGSCSVSYTDSTSGAPVLTAAYGGDSGNSPSSGAYILANFSPAATAAESTSTSTSGTGSAAVDQKSTTGVDVSVSGAPADAPVVVFSGVLPSQPPDTGTLSISGLGFYDVEISGVSSGTANVCIFNSGVASSTVLQYYFGGFWVSATGVAVTTGVSICGNIPVSALNGTPIVPGNPPGGPTSVPEFPLPNALLATFATCTLLYLLIIRRVRS